MKDIFIEIYNNLKGSFEDDLKAAFGYERALEYDRKKWNNPFYSEAKTIEGDNVEIDSTTCINFTELRDDFIAFEDMVLPVIDTIIAEYINISKIERIIEDYFNNDFCKNLLSFVKKSTPKEIEELKRLSSSKEDVNKQLAIVIIS